MLRKKLFIKTKMRKAISFVGMGFVLALFSSQLSAQQEIPRTADGRPDFNGLWQALGSAHWNIEPHAADFPPLAELGAFGSIPATLGIVDGGEIPYTDEARAQQQANRANWLSADPLVKCYMPGVPRATYIPHPFQIFQSESAFFIAYSFAGAVRNVFLEDPGPAPLDSWMGQSWGYWDGDVWVVEVTGLDDRTWFDRAGNYHSWELKVTERYEMIDDNVIMYSATMEDPQVFERPWTIEMPLYRRLEAGFELPQFKCVEFVEELMYGQYRKGGEFEQRLREEMQQDQ